MTDHRDPQSENTLADENHADWPIIPHEVLDCADCCGCLVVEVKGGQAEIRCNECAELIRTVPASEAERTMAELAATDNVCGAECPYCGAWNTFLFFSAILAFSCQECGEPVQVNTPVQ